MAPKSQSASQPTRRSIYVPSWVWNLALLAAAALALSAYHATRAASAASPQVRMDQAQESISHYAAELDAQRDPSAEDIGDFVPDHRGTVSGPARAASSAWDVPQGPATTNYGQTQHMSDYMRQKDAERSSRAIDPAVRSVLNYVGTHGLQYASEAPEVVLDADAKSYTDYLRRHGLLPIVPTWDTPTDPEVQALIDGFSLRLDEPAPQNDSLVNPTVQQRPAASESQHPEREDTGFPGLGTTISERDQQLLDRNNQ
jgi:hypothetical protein